MEKQTLRRAKICGTQAFAHKDPILKNQQILTLEDQGFHANQDK